MLTAVCCFLGRHEKVERVIRCFINQTYNEEATLLLYNNSSIPQRLDYKQIAPLLSENKNIRLVNNHLDLQTKLPYTNTGDIFRDAITYIDSNTKIITWMDSDDLFLPEHLEEGMLGIQFVNQMTNGVVVKSDGSSFPTGCKAYKPYHSYFLYGDKIELSNNNMEPSIFVYAEYIKQEGFYPVASSYHQKWLDKLSKEGKLFEDKNGKPTLLYDWSAGHNTHKISGLGDTIDNFKAHREYECDHGDGVLSCAPQSSVQKYYDLVNQL